MLLVVWRSRSLFGLLLFCSLSLPLAPISHDVQQVFHEADEEEDEEVGYQEEEYILDESESSLC